jgi:uroporphyrinogen decarboxylase
VLSPIRSVAEVDALRPEAIHDRLAPVYETVGRLAKEIPDETALIGFAGAPWTVATYMVEGGTSSDHATTKRWAYGDAEGFQRLIDVLVEGTVAYLLRQIDAGAEAVQIFDTWAGALPEPAFRRWCIEPMRAIAGQLRSARPDIPIIGFPRGAGVGYRDFVAETGVDGVSIDTTVPVAWAARALQSKTTVQGNLDPQMLVVGGDAMDREVTRILEGLADGPHIFNLGHGVVPQTPPEHVARLVETVRNWRP